MEGDWGNCKICNKKLDISEWRYCDNCAGDEAVNKIIDQNRRDKCSGGKNAGNWVECLGLTCAECPHFAKTD